MLGLHASCCFNTFYFVANPALLFHNRFCLNCSSRVEITLRSLYWRASINMFKHLNATVKSISYFIQQFKSLLNHPSKLISDHWSGSLTAWSSKEWPTISVRNWKIPNLVSVMFNGFHSLWVYSIKQSMIKVFQRPFVSSFNSLFGYFPFMLLPINNIVESVSTLTKLSWSSSQFLPWL